MIKNFNNFDQVNENDQGTGNKFIFVRFGNQPDLRVTRAFTGIALKTPQPVAMKGPGSIITIFQSNKTKEQCIAAFDAVPGINYDLYQIVHSSSGTAGPALVARKKNKAQLQAELAKAIEDENYERAAEIRTELKRL